MPTVLSISSHCILNNQDHYKGKSLFLAKTAFRKRHMLTWSLQFTNISTARCAVPWLTKSLESGDRLLSEAFGCSFHFHMANTHKCPLSFRVQSLVFEGLPVLVHVLLLWHCSVFMLLMTSLFLNPINNINPV